MSNNFYIISTDLVDLATVSEMCFQHCTSKQFKRILHQVIKCKSQTRQFISRSTISCLMVSKSTASKSTASKSTHIPFLLPVIFILILFQCQFCAVPFILFTTGIIVVDCCFFVIYYRSLTFVKTNSSCCSSTFSKSAYSTLSFSPFSHFSSDVLHIYTYCFLLF